MKVSTYFQSILIIIILTSSTIIYNTNYATSYQGQSGSYFNLKFTINSRTETINSIALNSNNSMIAAGFSSGILLIWNISALPPIIKYNKTHEVQITSLTWNPNGTHLATASKDGTINIWDTHSGSLFSKYKNQSDKILSIDWSPDGKFIAFGTVDNLVKIWDLTNSSEMIFFDGHSDEINEVKWSPNGKYLASCSLDKTIRIWNIQEKLLYNNLSNNTFGVKTISWNVDSSKLISSEENLMKVWDIHTAANQIFQIKENIGRINSIDWAHQSSELIALGTDRNESNRSSFIIYHLNTTPPLHHIMNLNVDINSVSWSTRDNYMIVFGAADGTISIIELVFVQFPNDISEVPFYIREIRKILLSFFILILLVTSYWLFNKYFKKKLENKTHDQLYPKND